MQCLVCAGAGRLCFELSVHLCRQGQQLLAPGFACVYFACTVHPGRQDVGQGLQELFCSVHVHELRFSVPEMCCSVPAFCLDLCWLWHLVAKGTVPNARVCTCFAHRAALFAWLVARRAIRTMRYQSAGVCHCVCTCVCCRSFRAIALLIAARVAAGRNCFACAGARASGSTTLLGESLLHVSLRGLPGCCAFLSAGGRSCQFVSVPPVCTQGAPALQCLFIGLARGCLERCVCSVFLEPLAPAAPGMVVSLRIWPLRLYVQSFHSSALTMTPILSQRCCACF